MNNLNFTSKLIKSTTSDYEDAFFIVWAKEDITRNRLAISVKEGLRDGLGPNTPPLIFSILNHCSLER